MGAPPPTATASCDAYYLRRTAILNRCNLTALELASQRFQDDPQHLEIRWAYATHGGLLDALARLERCEDRSELFADYATSLLWKHEDRERWPAADERRRSSYRSVIIGWGADSNSRSAAILKGWAEDCFGLRSIWHDAILGEGTEALERFSLDRMRLRTRGIAAQLDLMFTYCQEELARRHRGRRWLTLYRGTHDPEAYTVKGDAPRGSDLVEFNCVSSFTEHAEVAWEFGSQVWRVRVPLAKIVYFSGLFSDHLLRGEGEHIVLGGDYHAERVRC